MRVSSRFVSALCVASLLLPIGANAAAAKTRALRLRDVVNIVQANTKPLAFDATLKGAYGKNRGTITIKGTQNGDMKTLKDAAAEFTVGMDLSFEDGSRMQAKARVILVHSTIYMNMQEITIKGDLAEWATNEYEQYLNTWVSVPIDPQEYAQVAGGSPSTAPLARLDQFFSITKTETGDKTTYDVTIPKEQQRRLVNILLNTAGGYTRSMRSSSRAMARATSLLFDAKVVTVRTTYDSSSATVSFKTTMDGQNISFTLNANAKTLKTKPKIVAPAESVPYEEFDRMMSGSVPAVSATEDAQRTSDVHTIDIALASYRADGNGTIPAALTPEPQHICARRAVCDGVSLDFLLGTYLDVLPRDPAVPASSRTTGYTILRDNEGRVTIAAPLAEGATISVTR